MSKRNLILFLMIALIIISFISAGNPSRDKKATEEVLKKFDENSKVKVIIKLKEDKLRSKASARVGIEDRYKNYIQTEITKEELENLEKNSSIEKISASHEIRILMEETNEIINASLTRTKQVADVNLSGRGQVICIIDTGVDFTHPDLIGKNKSCVIDCYDKGALDNCNENCSIGDPHGHGTHCAGVAAASGVLLGVATNASIIGVKVLNSDGWGSGSDYDVSKAIDYCTDNGATVISLSLGTVSLYESSCEDSMSLWTKAVNRAYAQNVSIIAATGNDASSTGIASPACIYNVTPVGDTYDSNIGSVTWNRSGCTDATTSLDKIVCHANRNSLLQLLAPGAMINSTKTGGSYIEYGGTSMATPVVAGAFAVMHQFLNITGQSKTPLEIENILNNTGKTIYDSVTGIYFSRIQLYSAIKSLDNVNPNSSLIFPVNNHVNISFNHSFYCNVSDWQLDNVTFYLWNSTGIEYNHSVDVTGEFSSHIFNVTNLGYKNYEWNCRAADIKNNRRFADTNYTLTIGGISASLASPLSSSYTNTNLTNFTCSLFTETNYELSNVTFYLWYSNSSITNSTFKEIKGYHNTTSFIYYIPSEGEYEWNCLGYNNNSNHTWAVSNSSVIFDETSPNITLISPSNLSSYETSGTQSINFRFNVSDPYGIENCSLMINNAISLTNSSIITSINQSFTNSFSSGIYLWNIRCFDNAGNSFNSNQRKFTISQSTSNTGNTGDSGGGGGGATATYTTYTVTNAESSGGYTQTLGKDDRISFTFFDTVSESHLLTLKNVYSDSVEITIQSEPINLKLGVGQSAKINLTSKEYYDLYVKLNSIINGKASLTIQTIKERIPNSDLITGEVVQSSDKDSDNSEEQELRTLAGELKNLKLIVYILVLGIILIILILLLKGKNESKKIQDIKKRYKEKFDKALRPNIRKKK
jgi:subtilisin family serine protease